MAPGIPLKHENGDTYNAATQAQANAMARRGWELAPDVEGAEPKVDQHRPPTPADDEPAATVPPSTPAPAPRPAPKAPTAPEG